MANMQLAKPTAQQLAWHDLEMTMFVHFDLATFDGGGGYRVPMNFDLSRFDPAELDVEQWCDVAESLGAKQIVHVAKHGSGFCNWQTKTTDYSIRNTPWRNGRGDIVKDLSECCRRRGMKFGVYLCPYDAHHGAVVAGVCSDPESQRRYNEIYRQQLTELLTQYGEMSELWFDGSTAITIEDILDKYAPGVVCFLGPRMTLRWPGTEKGVLPYPAWNAVPKRDADTGKVTAIHGRPDGECWLPMECDTPIRDHYWFWDVDGEKTIKSLDTLMEVYYRSVGHGGVLLLNANPDTRGLIPEADAKRTAEFGAEIKRRFGRSIAETTGVGATVELDLGKPTTIDHVITMEDIAQGERVRRYVIEGTTGDDWYVLCDGLSIGHKKIDFFAATTASKIRFRCIESVDTALIRRLAVFHVGTIPTFDRNAPISIENPMIAARIDLVAGTQTVRIDLADACRTARRYEVEILPDNDDSGFVVRGASVFKRDALVPHAVLPMSSDRVLDLNITWVAEPTQLELTIDSPAATKIRIVVR